MSVLHRFVLLEQSLQLIHEHMSPWQVTSELPALIADAISFQQTTNDHLRFQDDDQARWSADMLRLHKARKHSFVRLAMPSQ
jgi:hypothetical protein